jgi:hypothetical protein
MNPKYKSKFEARIAAYLKKMKVPFEYEARTYKYKSRPRMSARCGECGSKNIYVDRRYTPDFFLKNGVIIESKGKWAAKDRYKMLDVREANPTLNVRMLFMSDNKISKVSKTRYSRWCEDNNIIYAVGTIPKEWLK